MNQSVFSLIAVSAILTTPAFAKPIMQSALVAECKGLSKNQDLQKLLSDKEPELRDLNRIEISYKDLITHTRGQGPKILVVLKNSSGEVLSRTQHAKSYWSKNKTAPLMYGTAPKLGLNLVQGAGEAYKINFCIDLKEGKGEYPPRFLECKEVHLDSEACTEIVDNEKK